MTQVRSKPTVYLDHSVMDFLEKKKFSQSMMDKLAHECLVCYSPENVKEMVVSTDYVDSFCGVLERLDAFFMSLDLNQTGRPNECNATKSIPAEVMASFQEQSTSLAESSMREFLALSYGVSDQSCGEAFADMGKSIDETVRDGLETLKEEESVPETDILRGHLKVLRGNSFSEHFSQFGQLMDRKVAAQEYGSAIEQYEKQTGLSTAVLCGLKGQKNIVTTIEQMEAEALGVPVESTSLSIALNLDHIKTRADRVTLVYNWLNWIGYRRDKGSKTNRGRFNGYQVDMGHVSYAGYCDMFITRDERQADKARAAFEFLQLNTVVVWVKN